MEHLTEKFDAQSLNALSTLTLAHIGDGVYELLARTHVARNGACRSKQMHSRTVALARAEAQSRAAHALIPHLSEEEQDVFRRGRNARPKTVPRHASSEEYAYATALEALFGWLYLSGRNERVLALWDIAREASEA